MRIKIFTIPLILFIFLISANYLAAQCPDDTLPVSPSSVTICEGEGVSVTVGNSEIGVTYRLKDGSGTVISSDFSGNGANLILTSSALTAATTIQVEAELLPCTLFLLQTVNLSVNAIPSAPTASDPVPICEGQPTPSLTASGSGTFRWYSDAGLTNQIGVGSPFIPSSSYVDNSTA